jgi:MFS family permease
MKSTSRFLVGFGFTFAGSAAPLLITEVAFPSHRGQATSIYNSLWCVLFCCLIGMCLNPFKVSGQHLVSLRPLASKYLTQFWTVSSVQLGLYVLPSFRNSFHL